MSRIYLFLVSLILIGGTASAQTKLLRFPDVHKGKVAFCYAGDLWTASAAGGRAIRLTAHKGQELFPRFSPDGKWIAFTGQYDGDEQVYVMPSTGGVPQQLTWYPARGPLPPRWGYDNQVYGWTPEGDAVLFRSMRDGWTLTATRLFTVPVDGGLPTPLAMPVSGGGDISPGGTKVVYSPLTRDFRTWKRYQGGWAQNLFIFDLDTAEIEPVSHSKRTERDPMWIGNAIYFASDRTGTLNLFRYDLESKDTTALTSSSTNDVRWPSRGEDGEIVYELAGELWIYDTLRGSTEKLEIEVPDDGLASRPARISVASNIESFSLAPKGERALFVARGDVFTAPIENGPTRNLTRTSTAHDKSASWSPDGSTIAFLSDMTGEEEIYLIDQDGSGEPRQLTEGGTGMRYTPRWSPDSERLAFNDKNGDLFVVEVESGAMQTVDHDRGGNLSDFTWSPHGGYIAYSKSEENGNRSLFIWTRASGEAQRVTGDTFSEYEPVWDPDGEYIYYLSDRTYAPQISNVEWNFGGNRTTGVFCMALRGDVIHPFSPESDEVTIAEEEEADEDGAEEDGDEGADDDSDEDGDAEEDDEDGDDEEEDESLDIDFDGLAVRVCRVPVEADNYYNLNATADHLIFVRGTPFFYGRGSSGSPAILAFSFEDRETETVMDGAGGYATSPDGSKLFVGQGGGYHVLDAKPGAASSKKTVSTGGLFVDRVPREEWVQIFDEVWRRFRDFFYVENMHGYDWDALRERYRPLVEHVGHRSDLNYVMGEMVAELNVGHAYITGGDWETPARPRVALPGCRFELDEAAGRYRVASIFRGQNEENRYRSPLTEIGVDVNVGDYVLAIDGEDLGASDNPYELLRHKSDRPVTLTVNGSPSQGDAREVTFNPLTAENSLLYLDMVLTNRERVDELSGGRLGYIHLPNMGADGIREFIKWYYAQIPKEGLVVDVRENGGGNVSQMVLERLRRTLLGTAYSRTSEYTGTYPRQTFHGPMACILNQNSASDGDIFPWMFRNAKLGPLIGMRSWGGVVGITSRGPLIDGGGCNVPEFGHGDARGQWAVEGHGVDPDIEVENDPKAELEGRDPQLERAVAEVLRAVDELGMQLPPRPADPVKTE
jgi:tricorn protease